MIPGLFFVIGAMMGSAANALVDRLPRRESWVRGRSRCDKCRHVLGWQDLVPVVSYLILKGKCRYCRSPIPYRNLVVEVFLGVSFGLVAQLHSLPVAQLILMGILWVTTIIAVMDWETRLVSELMVVLWGAMVIAHQFSNNFQSNLIGSIVGAGVIGGIWAVTKGKAMGFGDVEIAAVMGGWLGWPVVAPALWIAFVAGAVVGGGLLVNVNVYEQQI